jgi:uncharacterized protein involved in exopolysaccharide biosynthesis
MTLETKRKLLQQKIELRSKTLKLTHPAIIKLSKELDKVTSEIQKTIKK